MSVQDADDFNSVVEWNKEDEVLVEPRHAPASHAGEFRVAKIPLATCARRLAQEREARFYCGCKSFCQVRIDLQKIVSDLIEVAGGGGENSNSRTHEAFLAL
jgi:hypothetical protein